MVKILTFCKTIVIYHLKSFFAECIARLDMAFLLASSKLSVGNFRRLVTFVRDLTVAFRVSASKARVGMVIYDWFPHEVFGFRKYKNNGALYNRMNDLLRKPYKRTKGTRTGKAMRFALGKFFGKRSDVPKVMVIITSRKSSDGVNRYAYGICTQNERNIIYLEFKDEIISLE